LVYLVTGSAGFIGYHVARALIKEGSKVVGVDNLNDYYPKKLKIERLKLLESKNFEFHEISLDELEKLKLKKKIDLALNFAAQPGVRVSKEEELNYFTSNINGFKYFLDFCSFKNIENIIYASSSSVYGNADDKKLSEKSIVTPASLYGLSKLFNENLSDEYSLKRNLKMVGLRFFTVYGPYGRPDMAYYKFFSKLKNSEEITIYNDGEMFRDMTYIDDITDGILKARNLILDSKDVCFNKIFNLGSGNPVKTKKLLEIIESRVGKKANIRNEVSFFESSMTNACLRKSKSELNYMPKTSINDGLNNFFDWFEESHE
tara:strand:- start:2431 stop:3381 length:951 start_codon:yes stop_codon:yes gene_type:complete